MKDDKLYISKGGFEASSGNFPRNFGPTGSKSSPLVAKGPSHDTRPLTLLCLLLHQALRSLPFVLAVPAMRRIYSSVIGFAICEALLILNLRLRLKAMVSAEYTLRFRAALASVAGGLGILNPYDLV